jgi:altronate dehydratase small subunit
MKHCFQVDQSDNVSTLLDDADNEILEVLGAGQSAPLHVRGPVKMGHKAALRDIAAGAAIVKYGVPIGVATRDIVKGEWVSAELPEPSGFAFRWDGSPFRCSDGHPL